MIAIVQHLKMSEVDPNSLPEDSLAKEKAIAEKDVLMMQRVSTGEDAAMAFLVDRWKGPLVRFFNRSLHSLADAEELSQITFLKLYRAAERYQPTAKFSTYLFTIARRVLLDEHKRRTRHPVDAVDPVELRAKAEPANKIRISELEESLEQCLSKLPENQRTAILLRVQRELAYEEIAAIMKASEGAVKTWIHRARAHLRDNLNQTL